MALTKDVERGDPFHRIVELLVNPDPFTVSVNAVPPACAIAGLRLLMAGVEFPGEIVKVEPLDTKALVLTVTVAAPCVRMSPASMVPVNWLAFPKNVTTGDPFQRMTELAANPEPFTVMVNAAPPACAVAGLRLVIAGVAGPIVNIELLDTAPFVPTVTAAVPCAAIRLAATVVVSWVAPTKVVGRGTPFH